ncbi:MAG: hypothetical protein ACKVRP_04460 [Bacteroidota bacterium]
MPRRYAYAVYILSAWVLVVTPFAAGYSLNEKSSQTPQQTRRNIKTSPVAGVKQHKNHHTQRETRHTRLPLSFVHTSSGLLSEPFESPVFPPSGWLRSNPDPGSVTWEYSAGVSGFGRGTGSAWMNFFDYEFDRGDVDLLHTPPIAGLTLSDSLFFDYAYAEYDDPSFGPDSLLVLVSINGGLTFDTLFAEGGETLATSPETASSFVPLSTQWLTRRVGFPPSVVGASAVILFVGVNNYGNNLYLDNVIVGVIPAIDLHTVDVLSPVSGSKQRTSIQPLAVFRNAGTAGQTGTTVRFQILNSSNSIIYNNVEVIASFPASAVDTVAFPDFVVPATPGVYTARAIASTAGDANTSNDTVAVSFYRPVDLAGVITVGAGGQIPTLTAAIDSLNRNDVGGHLTFQLINVNYFEPVPLTITGIDGTGPSATVTFRPAPGISPTIQVEASEEKPYAIGIIGARYVTLDGLSGSLQAESGGMTIIADGEYGMTGVYIAGVQGRSSSYTSLKNLRVRTAADSLTSSSGYYGIFVKGMDSAQKDTSVVISECDITQHGQAGIAAENAHNLIVENSTIHDWVQHGGFTDLRGIWLSSGTSQAVVRGNVVRNIHNRVNGWWTIGVQNGAGTGSALLCANNMITNISSSGAGSDQNLTAGILSSSILNSSDTYLFNSVFLFASDSSASPTSRVCGFEFSSIAPPNIRVSNNIVSNTSSIAGAGLNNKAYAVYYPALAWVTSDTSDRNNWHTPTSQGSVGFFNGSNRIALADWQSGTGQDANSLSADPLFVDAANLHISTGSSPVSNAGTPMALVSADIDGEARSATTPDMGADEFSSTHVTVSVPIVQGWNMISNPVTKALGADSVRHLYPTSTFPYVFGFQGSTGYVATGTLQNGPGYWGKFPAGEVAYVGGDLLSADTIVVQTGWNMVGSISVGVDTAAVVSIPAGIRSSQWFGYDLGYFSAGQLLPGRAYWVKVAAPGQFILTSPP